ncbi:MAG: hypothetical protein ABJC12_02540 [Saprospiraceae bacterium]
MNSEVLEMFIIENCKNMPADVLLPGGQKSQQYFKTVLDALSGKIRQAKRVEFSCIGHLAAENGGRPKIVADELRKFFNLQHQFYRTEFNH